MTASPALEESLRSPRRCSDDAQAHRLGAGVKRGGRPEAGDFRVDVVRDLAGFTALRPAWEALTGPPEEASLPTSWNWYDAWLRGFWPALEAQQDAELRILVVRDHRGVAAIAPLASLRERYHGLPVRVVRTLANGSSIYWDLVWRADLHEEEHRALCRALFDALPGPYIHLRRLHGESPLRYWLAEGNATPWRVVDRDHVRTPLVLCEGTWDDHASRLSRKFRKGLAKKLRDFETAPGTRTERVALASGDDPGFDYLVTVSRGSWKAGVGRDLESREEHRAFLSALLDHLGPMGQATLWVAWQEEAPIAAELHVADRERTYPIQADFAEHARALSPGSVVEHDALRAAFESERIAVYDTCADAYWYLQRLTDRYRDSFTTFVFAPSVGGRTLHFLEHRVKPIARGLRETLGRGPGTRVDPTDP